MDTKSATGRLILTIFAGFAQFEREMMLERQREGIAKAHRASQGRRSRAALPGGKTVTEIATALEIGRGSVYRALEAAGERAAAGA